MMDFGKATRGGFIRAQGQRSRAACLVQFAGRVWRACRARRRPESAAGPAIRCRLGGDGLVYLVPACAGQTRSMVRIGASQP